MVYLSKKTIERINKFLVRNRIKATVNETVEYLLDVCEDSSIECLEAARTAVTPTSEMIEEIFVDEVKKRQAVMEKFGDVLCARARR